MSTQSDQWHNAPKEIHTFYASLYRRYRQFIGTDFLGLNAQMPMHFYLFSRSHNVGNSLPPEPPYWVPGGKIDDIIWSIWPNSPVGAPFAIEVPIADQWPISNFPAAGYPRAKYKVARRYWTGKPKHRRNI